MYYLYLKLRVFLKRKVQLKNVLKMVVSFIYNIDITCNPKETNSNTLLAITFNA